MSFLSRLFGSKTQTGKGEDVEVRLAYLEKEAEKAKPGYVGSALNRAGDLALKADQPDRAVGFYGRAIDAFLEDAQRELARGVANKIIRVRPTAIRTLCTITWLDLAARHQASALMHLRDYVSAAAEANQQARAATQIHFMAATSPDSEFIDAVADALDALDYPLRAKQVRGWIASGAPEALDDALALSDACMQAAVSSNDADVPFLLDDPDAVYKSDSVEEASVAVASGAEPQEPLAAAETAAEPTAEVESESEATKLEEAEPEAIAVAGSDPEPEAVAAADSEPEPEAIVAAERDPEPNAEAVSEPEMEAVETAPKEDTLVERAADDSDAASSKRGKGGKGGKRRKSKKNRKKKRKG